MKSIGKRTAVEVLVMIQILMLVIFPPVSADYSLWRITIWSVFAIISAVVVIISFISKPHVYKEGTMIVVTFLLLNACSYFVGLKNGIPLKDYIRGILPFLYFLYIYVIEKQGDNKLDYYEKMFEVVAIVHAVKIIFAFFYYDCLRTNVRVTMYVPSFGSLIIIIGIICFFGRIVNGKHETKEYVFSWVGLILCWVSIIITQTKALVISTFFGILIITFLICRLHSRVQYLRRISLAILVLIIEMSLIYSTTNLGQRWINSIIQKVDSVETSVDTTEGITEQTLEQIIVVPSMEGEKEETVNKESATGEKVVVMDTVRVAEIKYAINTWKTAPITGKGCGYRWKSDILENEKPHMYMHNILAYFLMDYGIFGILWLILFGVIVIKRMVEVYASKPKDSLDQEYISIIMNFSVIASAFLYANMFAVFRNIDFIFLFSIITGIYFSRCRRIKELIEKKNVSKGEVF